MRSHSTSTRGMRHLHTIRTLQRRRFPIWRSLMVLTALGVMVYQVRGFVRQPKAILVLGGALEREAFAVEFAQDHPELPIWVSSGSNPEYTEWLFSDAGIDLSRLRLDYQAVDTVTNFTTLVNEFEDEGINSVYLITSDYHMPRAQVIGEIVLGSRDIDFRPISVASERSSEPFGKVARDAARSLLWVTTGYTGSTIGHRLWKDHQH